MDLFENIDAAIFDLDGTLVDSMWMWKKIDEVYLAGFGLELPPDLQGEIEGMSFTESAVYFQNRFGIKDDIATIKNCWNNMAMDMYKNDVRLKTGVPEVLNILKKRGIKTGIATSNSPELVKTVLERNNADGFFDAVHTACEVEHGKPFPDIYLYVADKLKVSPDKCLVFEDIIAGIRAGKAAGMKVCSVYDEYSHDSLREKIGESDYYFRTFDEMLCCISN